MGKGFREKPMAITQDDPHGCPLDAAARTDPVPTGRQKTISQISTRILRRSLDDSRRVAAPRARTQIWPRLTNTHLATPGHNPLPHQRLANLGPGLLEDAVWLRTN